MQKKARKSIMNFVIRMVDIIVDVILIILIAAMVGFGVYALWDDRHIYEGADASVYEIYHPSEQEIDGKDGLDKLKAINPDVIAWLQIDDTKINYPVVQGKDNIRYISADAVGNYSLSGSIFLDYRDASDFSSPNNIIYGHHMAKDTMFGQLDDYCEKEFFDAHCTGKLYFDGGWHNITFFAFLQADAYDKVLYDPKLSQCKDTDAYIDYLREHAQYFKELEVSSNTRFITLSTCRSSGIANGRYLLVGIIEQVEAGYSK